MWVEGMPESGFRFRKRELNRWVDGKQHVLRPGEDFPPGMDMREIKRRLVQAAKKRDVDIAVWYALNGNVHFLMVPWGKFRGGNPD